MALFFNSWLRDLSALFFPQNCAVCGKKLLDQEEVLCTSCYYKLPFTGFCKKQDNPVMEIFQGRLPLVSAASLLFYAKGGMAQQLIHQLKYKGKSDIGPFLGKLLGNHLSESPFFQQADFLVPVPLHPKKEHTRGYNQSLLIANGIAEHLQAAVLPDVIYRRKHSSTQTKKSRYERWENVKDIFALKDGHRLRNKHIILVDDVITTGATLEACGNTLLDIPGLRLSVVSLAYAQD